MLKPCGIALCELGCASEAWAGPGSECSNLSQMDIPTPRLGDVPIKQGAAVPVLAPAPVAPLVFGTAPIALAIMAKRPQAGEVKTRLCPPLTPEKAAQVAHAFLLDKLEQARRIPGVARFVAFFPSEAEAFFRTQAGEAFFLLPQRGADLGERLTDVSDRLLGAGFSAVMIIGTDSPTLPDAALQEAQEALARDQADVVLGPVDDGGYYLIGLRRPSPSLFHGIEWSTDTVLLQTLARAKAAGLRTHLLPRWFDVDTEPALRRLGRDLADDRIPASRTRTCLLGLASPTGRDGILG
jgi:uncharacterized protein